MGSGFVGQSTRCDRGGAQAIPGASAGGWRSDHDRGEQMSKLFHLPLGRLLALGLGGSCGYDGAIFVEGNYIGIGVRAAPETTSPVKLNLGYEHDVISFVPRRKHGPLAGEATSMVFSNNVASKPLPSQNGNPLVIDSIFV